jgi:hypothetical protein
MGWIAWVKGLTHRAEVLRIASRLSIDPQRAAACCMLIWEWADDETEDGGTFVPLLSLIAHADRVTGVPGFGQAFSDVGWLIENANGSMFPNFDRWNGETAKQRLKEAARKASWRKRRDKCPANDGTKTGPREEKRILTTTPPTPPRGGSKKTKNWGNDVPFSQRPENQNL